MNCLKLMLHQTLHKQKLLLKLYKPKDLSFAQEGEEFLCFDNKKSFPCGSSISTVGLSGCAMEARVSLRMEVAEDL